MMRKKLFRLWMMVAWAVMFGALAGLASPHTALAATKLDGYTLSIDEAFSSLAYGGTSPTVVATLTTPADSTDQVLTSNFTQPYFYILLDSTEKVGYGNALGNHTYTSTIPSGVSSLSIGVHTLQAVFHSVSNNATITSDTLTLTVKKASLNSLSCNLTSGPFYQANSSWTTLVSLSVNNAVTDVDTATYTMAFTGPQTLTEDNLSLNGGQLHFTFPSVPGTYQYTLTYSGTAQTNAKSTSGTINVTAANPVSIALYSNPGTTTAGATVTYDITVSGSAGSTPTGNVVLMFGNWFTQGQPLDASGSLLIRVKIPSVLDSDHISVVYVGNFVYANTVATFPLTNQSDGRTGTGSGLGSATPTVTGSGTATPTGPGATGTPTGPSPSATATVSGQATGTPSPATLATTSTMATPAGSQGSTGKLPASSSFPGKTGGIMLGLGGLVLIGVGSLGFWTWRRRKQQRSQHVSSQP